MLEPAPQCGWRRSGVETPRKPFQQHVYPELELRLVIAPPQRGVRVVVGDLGLPGIFLLMAPESACIPIPSEATMLFAGTSLDLIMPPISAPAMCPAPITAMV